MIKTAQKLLKSNKGDGYIWFIGMTVVLLLFFGALFGVMKVASDTRETRQEIDAAAAEVMEDVRHKLGATATTQDNYDKLIKASFDGTHVDFTNSELFTKFAEALHQQIDPATDTITKLDAKENPAYIISNFDYLYMPSLYEYNNNARRTKVIGDWNLDGTVNSLDLALLNNYITKDVKAELLNNVADLNNDEVINEDDVKIWLDLNEDNSVDEADIVIEQKIVLYFETNPTITSGTSAMIVISFDIEIPINLGAYTFGSSKDRYTYPFIYSFK